jgi:hypothetical protein
MSIHAEREEGWVGIQGDERGNSSVLKTIMMMRWVTQGNKKGQEFHGPEDKKTVINGRVCKDGKSMQLDGYTSEGGKQEMDAK